MSPYASVYHTLFGARKSNRYHQRRRSFLEWVHTTTAALQVIGASSAAAAVLGDETLWGVSFAAFAAVVAALDLVIGTSRRATLHASLAVCFSQLEQDMVPQEFNGKVSAGVADEFRRRRLRIEQDEPSKLRVVDILCHNELVAANVRYEHEDSYTVDLWRRWIGHVWDVEVDDILAKPIKAPREELQTAEGAPAA